MVMAVSVFMAVIAVGGLTARYQPARPIGDERGIERRAFGHQQQPYARLGEMARGPTTDAGADHRIAVVDGAGQAAAASFGFAQRAPAGGIDGHQGEIMAEAGDVPPIGGDGDGDGRDGDGKGHDQDSLMGMDDEAGNDTVEADG